MTTQELEYLVKVNDRDLSELKKRVQETNKALGQETASASSKGSAALAKFGASAVKGATVLLGGLAIGAVKAGKAAVDLGEQVNKAGVVFGKSGAEVVEWSKGLASSFGISQRAALEAAGVFGNMLVPMGFARSEAAGMSKQLVQLAGDMASFNNASPEETLEALRAGLAGETEPLRRFGVFLNEARIQQEALNLGLVEGNEKLTAAQKAQAIYSLILKDTKDAQGDFARTSDSLANRQRILAAQVENLGAKFGQILIPAGQAVAGVLQTIVGFLEEHTTAAQIAVGAIAALAAAVLVINGAYRAYRAALLVATAAQAAFNLVMSANPILLVVAALAALAAGFVIAYQKSETFRRIVGEVGAAIMGVLGPAFDWLKGIAQSVVDGIRRNWDDIRATSQAAWTAVKTIIETAWNLIKPIVEVAIGFIKNTVENGIRAVGAVLKVVMALIRGDWSAAWEGIKQLASAIWAQIKNVATSAFNGVKAVISGVWEAVKSLTGAVWNGIKGLLSGIWEGLKSLASTVWNGIKSTISSATNAVTSTVERVWLAAKETVKDAWQKLKDVASTVWNGIKSAISTATSAAERVINGFKGVLSSLVGAFQAVIGAAQSAFSWIGKVADAAKGSPLPFNIPGVPFLATGGRARAGFPHIVGEEGPELFIPDRSGTVIPSDETASLLNRVVERVLVTGNTFIVSDPVDAQAVGSALAARLAVLR